MSSVVETVNPATEEVLERFEFMGEKEIETLLSASHEAFGNWRRLPLERRLDCVRTLAEAMQAGRVTLAEKISAEMGKVSKEALAEVDKCVSSCRFLAENFPRWKAAREYELPAGFSVHAEPLGVILGIMPWNFPLWQVIRFAVPALACGNTVLLKHAPGTWGVATFIEDLFRQAFPDSAYLNLRIDVPMVAPLIADRRVQGVSLTGSRRAGGHVGGLAGAAIKKCVLELGGSDAYVILDDADIVEAAAVCARSRLQNAGQSCVSAKRFIVTRKNAAEFTAALGAHLRAAQFGDPRAATTTIGPLARRDLRDALAKQVNQSVEQGARLVFGGEVPRQRGFYYPPTLLAGVRPGQVAFDEELFGPVAAVIEAADEGQALSLANRSCYGLGGALFSRDIERAKRLAVFELDCGMAFVNDFVKSDASVPFGGIKESGIGRELGREGSFEFTNTKLVYVKP